jgi:AraC family transcriptional regulator
MRWQTHLATDQLLMLFLKPTILLATEHDKAVNKIALSPGCVGFNSRWVPKSVRSHDPVSHLCVRVADSALIEVARDMGWNEQLELQADRVIVSDQLTRLLYALEAERSCGYPSGPLFVDGIELAVATFLVKSYGVFPRKVCKDPCDEGKSGTLSPALPPHLLKKVLYRMQDLTADLNLGALASETGYSRRHFLRMFQKATGSTPHQYLLQSRLNRAKDLIKSRNDSLIDVAAASGFSSHAHMSKIFRKVLGVSPSEYRRSL